MTFPNAASSLDMPRMGFFLMASNGVRLRVAGCEVFSFPRCCYCQDLARGDDVAVVRL